MSYYHQQPQRSAIPKVIGILMIIFASLGLFGTLFNLLGGGQHADVFRNVPELKTWRTIEILLGVVALALGALHLYGGVRAVGYKTNAPRVAVVYGVAAMFITIVNAILVYAWAKPMLEKVMRGLPGGELAASMFGPMVIFGTLIGLAWPTLVIILMTRPQAKASCVNEL